MSTGAKADGDRPESLEDLRWQYRVILVFAPEPQAARALSNLAEFSAGIEERDIAWFLLGEENSLHTNFDEALQPGFREQLMARYFMPVPNGTAVLLIGKDGTVKSRSGDLDLEATFGLIDQMPMRRAEMRNSDDRQ
jgi:hypothetical protein